MFASAAFIAHASPAPTKALAARAAEPSYPPGSLDLVAWTYTTLVDVFPNNSNWEVGFEKHFDPSLTATFGLPQQNGYLTKYTYDTWKQLYAGIYAQLSSRLSFITIEIKDVVAYPFPDDPIGGYVYFTGLEYGTFKNGTDGGSARDAGFVVVKNVDGVRKIVELREASNYLAHATT